MVFISNDFHGPVRFSKYIWPWKSLLTICAEDSLQSRPPTIPPSCMHMLFLPSTIAYRLPIESKMTWFILWNIMWQKLLCTSPGAGPISSLALWETVRPVGSPTTVLEREVQVEVQWPFQAHLATWDEPSPPNSLFSALSTRDTTTGLLVRVAVPDLMAALTWHIGILSH